MPARPRPRPSTRLTPRRGTAILVALVVTLGVWWAWSAKGPDPAPPPSVELTFAPERGVVVVDARIRPATTADTTLTLRVLPSGRAGPQIAQIELLPDEPGRYGGVLAFLERGSYVVRVELRGHRRTTLQAPLAYTGRPTRIEVRPR